MDDAAAPTRPRSGCLFWLIALPVVVIGGLILGSIASDPDEGPDETAVRLDEGTEGGGWRVDAVRLPDGDICAFIYLRGERQQSTTGGCDTSTQDKTLDGGEVTILFGKAPDDARRLAVPIEPGRPVEVDTVGVEGIEGRFYVTQVEADVDAAGVPEVLEP